jgi:YegS/Rv2252/BmrU family lipid kinase
MQFKNIHLIINPASGKEEPILTYLHNAFYKTDIKWQVTVTTSEDDAYNTAKKLIDKTDLVVVYGGDGSVTKVAAALYNTETPMAIIPGGTANVMSKELGIPQDSREAIRLIAEGKSEIMKMDIGEANGTPFLLRINMGIMADMILQANTELKSSIGQLAYGVSALKTTFMAEPVTYKMLMDGNEVEETGVSLTVTNAGNIGIGDMSFLPGIAINDGFLDVILLNNADPLSLLQVTGSTIFQTGSDVLKHWRCKQITVKTNKPIQYICDDCEAEAKEIHIKIIPLALKILIPLSS